jgi:hypothetical protein
MRKVFRSREQSVAIAIFGGIVSVVVMAEAITIDYPDVTRLERVVSIIFGLGLGAFCLLRAARAGVYVLPEGIRIVNLFRTKFVPWRQIAQFSLRDWGPFPLMGHVDLIDHSSEHIFGIEAPNPLTRPRNRSAQKLIAELNEILDQVRSGRLSQE